MTSIRRRGTTIAAASAAAALFLSACGNAETPTAEVTEVETDTAVVTEEAPATDAEVTATAAPADAGTSERCQALFDEGGNLLIWSWEPALQPVVEEFNATHPNTVVTLNNVGMGTETYPAIQNALAAGSGAPDLAHIEYQVLPQFSIMGALADLSQFGAQDLDGTFSPGTWSAVTDNGHVYGLPMDSGPMALFYNQDIFDEYGLEVPTTWQQFVDEGRKLKEANPDIVWTTDGSDPGLSTSIMWQAGGRPFTVDGTTVGVDLANDPGTEAFAGIWQQLQDDGIVNTEIQGWSDEWFTALSNGTLATLITAGWMPANMLSGAPGGAGSWRVAPLPQFNEGEFHTAELGGSALTVLESSPNQELAYCFNVWANVGPGVPLKLAAGAFPATVADLNDEEFLSRPSEYFGGQEINRIFSDSAANVVEGWHYLPFMSYANSIFAETAGQAFLGHGTIMDGMRNWQDRLIQFGETQGFTMQ